jgi:hypothetical protein
MNTKELYLKTIFCCIACDGDIANEEVDLIRNMASTSNTFDDLEVEELLNEWIAEINENGARFLQSYLSDLGEAKLSNQEQLMIADLAIQSIEADNRIEYSEVKFFKKIRSRLSIGDEAILKEHPDKEDLLLPDIQTNDKLVWDTDTHFSKISLKVIKKFD